MQGELDAMDTDLPIEILGVNDIGLESGNASITSGRVLPWLQTDAENDVWVEWEVTYRDVYIVGPGNELLDVYNLTINDLGVPANYDTLKNLILEAASE